MEFNARLKMLRNKNKLTQGQLAEILELKPTAISNYESKRNEPSFDKLIALSRYFDVSCDYLLGITDAYLPVGGEVLDKDIVEFFNLFSELNPEYEKEAIKYVNYLIYRQKAEEAAEKEAVQESEE